VAHIDKPMRQEKTMTPLAICDACLTRPVFGQMQLRDDAGHLVAAWWSCAECADRDAPIHAQRGLQVAVVGFIESSW
jgi:hypothetical protein